MFVKIPLAAYVLSGSALTLTGLFALPSLTSGGASGMPGVTEAAFAEAYEGEMHYCLSRAAGVNCTCFARLSGMIVASQSSKPRHHGYFNQQDLAREQAYQKC